MIVRHLLDSGLQSGPVYHCDTSEQRNIDNLTDVYKKVNCKN